MSRMMANPRAKLPPLARWLAVTAIAMVPAFPVMAQEIDRLVAYRPDNRAGSAAAAAVIAEMIAERSESAAVRSRARSIAPQGALSVGADELLLDIGAHAHIGSITGGGAVVPVALTPAARAAPATRPVTPTPAPVVETVVVPTPTPTPAPPTVAVTPAATPAAAPTASRPQRNWGVSESFSSEMRDRGGSPSGGGGGGGGWN